MDLQTAVVVCYRNRPGVLAKCVDSLCRQSKALHLVLVDDCSKSPPGIAASGAIGAVETVRNRTWLGYTRSANRGLKRARASDVVILLNSDTEVPADGISKLVAAVSSGPEVGLAGPLSNAASWQSVPRRFEKTGRGWTTNREVAGFDVNELDEITAKVSTVERPQVPLLNGFCLAIRREVIKEIGLLDEDNFPIGYGEENDYVIRAQEAGFKCAVADDTFVYHAKSQSFGNMRRWWYSRKGGIALARKWGRNRIEAMCEEMRHNPTLAHMRRAVADELRRRGHPEIEWD